MSDQPSNAADAPPAAEPYRVLARKYRPQVFEDLIGQDAMVRTLANSFETGRIAQAFMLTGVRGIGKTTTARLIARALNYAPGDGPAMQMEKEGEHCAAILESRHVDVIEMDAASRTGIDDVREIIESVRYRPASARFKVYIIDEVHMLSTQAFNALLKTLEEPPPHVKFVFATTEIRKVPVTVLSRCQRFDLRRLDAETMIGHLSTIAKKENVAVEDEALRLIARASEGSVRDGLSLLDQAIAYGGADVKADAVQSMLGLIDNGAIIDLFELLMKGDTAAAIRLFETRYQAGGDPEIILSDLAGFVHWVSRIKATGDDQDAARSQDERTRGAAFAKTLGMPVLTRAWQLLLKGLGEVAQSGNGAMAAEMVLIRLAYASGLPDPTDLVEAVRKGEAQSAPPRPAPADPVPPAPASKAVRPEPFTAQAPVTTFAHIVQLADANRDLLLKRELTRLVRPIAVSPGHVELALEQGAPNDLAGRLGKRLEEWTGSRWIVAIAPDGGEEPLHRQQENQQRELKDAVRNHPDVQAVFEKFPDATIESVRRLDDPVAPAPPPEAKSGDAN